MRSSYTTMSMMIWDDKLSNSFDYLIPATIWLFLMKQNGLRRLRQITGEPINEQKISQLAAWLACLLAGPGWGGFSSNLQRIPFMAEAWQLLDAVWWEWVYCFFGTFWCDKCAQKNSLDNSKWSFISSPPSVLRPMPSSSYHDHIWARGWRRVYNRGHNRTGGGREGAEMAKSEELSKWEKQGKK